MTPAYAELFCRSNYSFLTGASHPEELVARSAELGYTALAITDECSMAGVVRAHVAAKDTPGMRLVVGTCMQLSDRATGQAHARLVLHAMSRRGYGHLCHWITLCRRRAQKGQYLAWPGDLEGLEPTAPMMAGLPDCLALLCPSPDTAITDVAAQARWLKTWLGDRAGLGLCRHLWPSEDEQGPRLQALAASLGMPLVATGDVLMHRASRKPLQDVLTATRLRKPLHACGRALAPNAEAHLRSRVTLAGRYPAAAMQASVAWAERCRFSLDELRYEYPREVVPDGATPASHLRHLTHLGLLERYPHGVPEGVHTQVAHELQLIEKLAYEPYFLTVADIAHWARQQGILCQGRGSAANSAVCYALGVTEVDPARSTLLFERFISEERREPPDIDIDFEHQRREEVIQYIYRKYGRHRAALTAVVTRYRPRSAMRDVGRALGLDVQAIEQLTRTQRFWVDGQVSEEALTACGFDTSTPLVQRWRELAALLVDFPRHLSQHPGGFVIARDTMWELVPVENAAMPGRSVIQWDKDDLDAVGLIKVDVLALGMLSALQRALSGLSEKTGRVWRMQDIPAEDPATYEMISQADTVGVFQIESRAQMAMLPRLRPRTFYDLVIEVAIVRPGPIQGGMVHPYLMQRHAPPDSLAIRDDLRPALARTAGVPIFQEQVMQIAMLAADFTPGEADQLRRAMAAWKRKGGLEPFHDRLVSRMVEKGYERDYAERIFRQIQGFGEYGFPESHAASFALLVYVSAWIKCHHPDVFLMALLNSQPMGFYAPAQLVRDARQHGVNVAPVCVVHSHALASLSAPGHVRLGLGMIQGLAGQAVQALLQARAHAPFLDVQDMARRSGLDDQALRCLAQSGALAQLAGHRHDAAWQVAGVETRSSEMLSAVPTHEAHRDAHPVLPWPMVADDVRLDYQRVGLTLGQHPVSLLRDALKSYRVRPAAELMAYTDRQFARVSGLVTHRQRPPTAKGTVFVTLEDESGTVNVIIWPKVAQAQRSQWIAARLLTVFGQWQHRDGVRHLIAARVIDHTELLHGLTTRSRDFR